MVRGTFYGTATGSGSDPDAAECFVLSAAALPPGDRVLVQVLAQDVSLFFGHPPLA